MSVLVALGASCVAASAGGASIVSAIRASRRTADRDWVLLTLCWAGVALLASFVAWDQWDRVIA
ncbi:MULTISPECIES: hypothetical protein [unclassified Rathayibacter]|uniref:hypothetical protein n=1 Tax=unclassified Rathayibacter TaxID=2609250 RepID=UPI000CE89675|nr:MULTISPECIES: hypothetical protein [unclassified Rathayibacter]PPF47571.1 hypothetical protein C5E14_10000 [Rathayibacter sp. AY1A1]PPH03091.1 hypothetical protein C5C32_00725 [Rathayibacter sp. AY1G9]